MFNTAHQRPDDDEIYDSEGFAAELRHFGDPLLPIPAQFRWRYFRSVPGPR